MALELNLYCPDCERSIWAEDEETLNSANTILDSDKLILVTSQYCPGCDWCGNVYFEIDRNKFDGFCPECGSDLVIDHSQSKIVFSDDRVVLYLSMFCEKCGYQEELVIDEFDDKYID